MKVTVLSGATSANGQPSGAPPPFGTVGKALIRGKGVKTSTAEGFFEGTDDATVIVEATASGGTVACKVKMWGYCPWASGGTGNWFPMGIASSGTDADRGVLNNGAAIGVVVTNKLQFSDKVYGLSAFTAVYAEIVNGSISGTGTSVSVYLARTGDRS